MSQRRRRKRECREEAGHDGGGSGRADNSVVQQRVEEKVEESRSGIKWRKLKVGLRVVEVKIGVTEEGDGEGRWKRVPATTPCTQCILKTSNEIRSLQSALVTPVPGRAERPVLMVR